MLEFSSYHVYSFKKIVFVVSIPPFLFIQQLLDDAHVKYHSPCWRYHGTEDRGGPCPSGVSKLKRKQKTSGKCNEENQIKVLGWSAGGGEKGERLR